MPDYTVTVPSQMSTVARCRAWDFHDLPHPDDCQIIIDLGPLRTIAASAVVGVIATLAHLRERGYTVRIRRPRNEYVYRMLANMGFLDALATFAELERHDEGVAPIRRILPVIKTQVFRTERDVERLADDLTNQFQGHHELLPANLLQDVTTALAEAANNAVEHSQSRFGGFAVVQVRRMQVRGPRAYFVEIAVADAGVGIAQALGRGLDDENSIMTALEEGVTGTGQAYRGRGLYEIQQLISNGRWRSLLIHSGTGEAIHMGPGAGRQAVQASHTIPATFPGTLLTVTMPVQEVPGG